MAVQELIIQNSPLPLQESRGRERRRLERLDAAREFLFGDGVQVENEELASFTVDAPTKSDFPFLIFFLALAKDLADFGSLGVFGIFVNIIVFPIILLWLLGKLNFLKRWAWKRFFIFLIAEFIPVVSFFPFWAFFIFRAHAKEHEKIDKILSAIEEYILKK